MQFALRCLAIFVTVTTAATAFAQTVPDAPVAADSGVATYDMETFSGGVTLNGMYFDIRHQAASGLGYRNGYTQFGGFVPIWGSEDWFIAPNARLILTDDAQTGANVGGVARMYSDRFDRIFGFNAYYDYDRSDSNFKYDQVGFGFESLGRRLDFRSNAYIPTSNDHNFVRATGLSNNLVFFEHRLGFLGTNLVEQGLRGGDFEVGTPLFGQQWLRGYAGMYAYQSDGGSDPVGFRGRVEGWIANDLSIGMIVTHDNQFDTFVNAVIDWRFAGFQPTRYFPNFSTRDRMLMPVQRQWRVVTQQFEESVNVIGYNPRNDRPYFVVWVDNSNAGVGDGSYENPFRQLPANVPNQTDLVLVRRGVTGVTPLSGSITLPNFARMLGEGHAHVVDAYANYHGFTASVNDELLPDPAFRNTGLYPFLTSPGDIVTLNSSNEVAAFVMQNAGGAAITSTGLRGFHLHHLEIQNNAGGGIVLNNAQGQGIVTADGQTIHGGRISNINQNFVVGFANLGGLGNNGGPGGIVIQSGNVLPLNLTMFNVSMNATGGGQDYGVRLITSGSAIDATLLNVDTSGGNAIAGLALDQQLGALTANLAFITANNNDGRGIEMTGNGGALAVTANNITANGNNGDNLRITTTGGLFTGSITNGAFNNSATGSGLVMSTSGGNNSLTLDTIAANANALSGVQLLTDGGTVAFNADAITANGNTGDNFQLTTVTGTSFTGTMTNSQFNNSVTGSGLALDFSGGSAVFAMNNITATGNALYGVQVGAHLGAQVGNPGTVAFDGVTLNNSTLTGNGVDAAFTVVDGGAFLDFFVDPTDMSGSGRHGFRFDVSGGGSLVAALVDVNLDNSGQDAGQMEAAGPGGLGRGIFGLVDGAGSSVSLTLQNTTARSAADDGIYVGASNGGIALIGAANSSFENAGQGVAGASGIELHAESAGVINMITTNTSAGFAAGVNDDFGLTLTSQDAGSQVTLDMTGGNIDNAGVNAANAAIGAGAAATLNLTDMTGDNAGLAAVLATVSGGQYTQNFTNTTFENAGTLGLADGLNVLVDNGGVFNGCYLGRTFDNNNGAGFRVTATGAGSEANIHLEDGSANGNLQGGLVAQALAGGAVNLRTVNFEFNNNGTFGSNDFDGVYVLSDGANSAARLLFYQTSADGNARNGFNFEASNGGFMTARVSSISAQNNGDYGVRLDASGAGTNAFLLPEGTNTVLNNGLGSYSINYSNTATAIVSMMGSFNGLATDGASVNISNVGIALVAITGDGTDTINSNAGDGIDIRISDADQAGIRIAGYSSISSNAEDAIHIELTNIATAASATILGPTNASENGDDGVDITLTNVALDNLNLPANLLNLSIVTLTDNDPLNNCVPEPVNAGLNSLVPLPAADGLRVHNFTIAQSGGPTVGQDGIAVRGTNVSGPGGVYISNSSVARTDAGVLVQLDASTVGFVTLDGLSTLTTLQSGLQLIGTTLNAGDITISNNTVNEAGDNGILVEVDTSLASLVMDNNTVDSVEVDGIHVDLTGAAGGADVTLSNSTISNSNKLGVNLIGTGAALNSVLLDSLSVDASGSRGISVDLTNATGLTSVALTGPGSVTNSNGDGILVTLTGAAGTPDVTVDGYTVDQSAGRGIAVLAGAAPVGAVNISNNVVSNSTAGDGIRAIFGGAVGAFTMDNNTVDASSADGLHVDLSGATGGADVTISNSTISNSGGLGINFIANGATLGNVTIDPITITNSAGGDGLLVSMTGSTVNSILVDQVTVDNSAGRGIDVDLNTVSGLTSVAVTGQGLSSVTNSASDGIRVRLVGVTGTPDVTVDGYNVDQSGLRGIAVTNNGSPVGAVNVSNNTVSNSTGSDGIQVVLNGAVGSVFMDNNAVSDSLLAGIDLTLTGATGSPNVTLSNSSATNSGTGGVAVGLLNAALGDILLDNVSATNSGNNGVLVSFSNSMVTSVVLNEVSAATSGNRGIDVNMVNTTALSNVALTGPGTVTDSASDGIRVRLLGVSGVPGVTVDGYTVDNSGVRGIVVENNGSTVGAVNVSNNTVSDSLGSDGIQVTLSGLVGSVTMDNDVVSNSALAGIDLTLTGAFGGPDVTISNSSATNSGTGGVAVGLSNAILGDIRLDNVSATNSGNNGVLVSFANSQINSVTLNQVDAAMSANRGIDVNLVNTTSLSGVALTGPGSVSDSGSDGIRVRLLGVSGVPGVTVDGYTVDTSFGNGILVENNGSTVGAVSVSNNTVSNSNNGDGIQVTLSGLVGSLTMDNDVVSNSSAAGIDVTLNNSFGAYDVSLTNSSTTNSATRGVAVGLSNAVLGDILLRNVSATDSLAFEGVLVSFNNSQVASATLDQVNADNSGTDGISVNMVNVVGLNSIAVTGPGTVVDSGANGISVNLLGVSGTPDVTVDGYNVSNSGANGIVVQNNGSTVGAVNVSNNTVDASNGGEGVYVSLSGLVGSVLLDSDAVTNSFNNGIRVDLVGVTGAPDVTVQNSSTTDSLNGDGVRVFTNGSVLGDILLSNVSATRSEIDGIAVLDIAGSTINSVTLNSVNSNTTNVGDGVTVKLFGTTGLTSVALNGPGTVTDSGNDGIDVFLTGVSGAPSTDLTVDGFSVGNSFNRGIGVQAVNTNVDNVVISNNSVTNSVNLQGIELDLSTTGNAMSTVVMDSNTVDGSGTNGIDVDLSTVAGAPGDVTITDSNVSNSGGTGISLVATGATLGNILIDPITITNSGGDGLLVSLNTSTVGNITIDQVSVDTTGTEGIDVELSSVTINGDISITGLGTASVNNAGTDGIFVFLQSVTGAPNLTVDGYSVDNSGGNGIAVSSDSIMGTVDVTNNVVSNSLVGDGVQVLLGADSGAIAVDGNNISNSAGDGIEVNLVSVTNTPAVSVSNNTIDASGDSGVNLTSAGSTLGSVLLDMNTVTNSVLGDGVSVDFTGTTAADLTVSNSTITGNGNDGVRLSQALGANIGPVLIDTNVITGNNAHGVEFLVSASSQGIVTIRDNDIRSQTTGDGVHAAQVDDTDLSLDFVFQRNQIASNAGGRGVLFDLQYGAATGITLNASFENDILSNNGQEGLAVLMDGDVVGNVSISSDAVTANSFSGNFNADVSGNGGIGVFLSTTDTASFDLQIGGAGDQNTFDANSAAGVGMLMTNTGVQGGVSSTFDIANAAITNTTVGANANFAGDGVRAVLFDTSELRGATVGDAANPNTTISGNARDGVSIQMVQSSILDNLTVRNTALLGQNVQDNGVSILRRNDSKLTDVVITGNTITGHTVAGINVDLQGGNTDIENMGTYAIDVRIGGPSAADGNTISNNLRGIDLLVSADAFLDVDIQNNALTTNTSDGIRAQTDFFAAIVAGSTWQDNTFTSNGGDAIELDADRTSSITVTMSDTVIDNTVGASQNGILINATTNGAVTLSVTNTDILSVGIDGIQVNNTSSNNVNLTLNTVFIDDPEQDGIDIDNNASGDVNLTSLNTTVVGPGQTVGAGNGLIARSTSLGLINIISSNDVFREFGGDGVSLNASGSNALGPNLTATFTDMQSRFNGGRGVELLNSNDAWMDVTITGTTDPTPTDGAVATSRIEENGLNGLFVENNAGALNTDNQIHLTLDQTSVRGNGIAAVAPSDDDRNGVWIRAGTSTSGFINATVTSNVMSGNQNIDFVTQSFVATANPGVASQYTNPGGHVLDPLARLFLDITGNEGDQIDVTRTGASYSNADQFKSPGAIFTATNRLRNAQRFDVDDPGALPVADTVFVGPAPTTTTFAGNNVGEGAMPNGTFVNLGLTIGGTVTDINGYNAGTDVFTIAPALAAAPVAGAPFTVSGTNISGLGASTFRTPINDLAAGGNLFSTIISDFTDAVGIGGPDGGLKFGLPQTFTWDNNNGAMY